MSELEFCGSSHFHRVQSQSEGCSHSSEGALKHGQTWSDLILCIRTRTKCLVRIREKSNPFGHVHQCCLGRS